MRIISKVSSMRRLSLDWKKSGATIGFVPTMGALHAGHAALVKRAKRENDKVVVSIFVNPTQFSPGEDFAKYPRPFLNDRRLCQSLGVDALFFPSPQEMYPQGFCTFVEVENLSGKLCGHFRPGHFRGVATVVLKLFEAAFPEAAYFGEKDYQQLVIIRSMTRDLNLPVKIVGCPTVREKDGLALSSRNQYLSTQERLVAPLFYKALLQAARAVHQGKSPRKIIAECRRDLLKIPKVSIDYVSLVDADTLEDAAKRKGSLRLIAAIHLGKTRLIDNLPV